MAESTTILYAGQKFTLPATLTGAQALDAMKQYRPEIGENGTADVNADGSITISIKAQRKSAWFQSGSDDDDDDENDEAEDAVPANSTTILYAGQKFTLPAVLTGAQALDAMKQYRPEIGENGTADVNADGSITISIKAQRKSI